MKHWFWFDSSFDTSMEIFLLGVLMPCLAAGFFQVFFSAQVWLDLKIYERADHEYGEAQHWDSAVRTPVNSWTSLFYCLVGAFVAVGTGKTQQKGSDQKKYSARQFYGLAFSVSLYWLGVSSFLFHASLTEAFRALDSAAALGVPIIPMFYALHRFWVDQCQVLILEWPLRIMALGIYMWCHWLSWNTYGVTKYLPVAAGFFVFSEYGLLHQSKTGRDYFSLATSVILGALGIAIRKYEISDGGHSPGLWLCHALWHALTSALILVQFYTINKQSELLNDTLQAGKLKRSRDDEDGNEPTRQEHQLVELLV